MKTIYLAGPINGCTDEEMSGWRNNMKGRTALKCKWLDPTDRDYRDRELTIGVPNEIVTLDKLDIRNSDYIVVWYTKPSVGTSMEIFYAHSLGKPVVLVNRSGRKLSPWLVYHSTSIVMDIEEAISTLNFWGSR